MIADLVHKYEPMFPTFVFNTFKYLDWGIRWYHPERYDEISGIAEEIGVNPSLALMLNYIYEFSSFCTSMIAKMDDGTLVHLRHLDFGFPD